MSASSGLKVAARLSPPDSMKMISRSPKRSVISATAARLMDASSRMAVCGTAGLDAHDALGRQRAGAGEELRVLPRIDVVGHDGHAITVAHVLAEAVDERGLAGADGAAD